MLTRVQLRTVTSIFIIIVTMIALLAYAFVFASTVHAAQVTHDVPGGWHALYNVGQNKCLNLALGTTLQRCDARSEEQQYAALTMPDESVLLLNRASAQCLAVADMQVAQVACAAHPRHGTALDWTLHWLGMARFHLLSDGRAVEYRRPGTGGQGLVLTRMDGAEMNQVWMLR